MGTVGDESQAVAQWLTTTLTGSSDLMELVSGGVWEDPAPQTAGRPVVTFSLLSALPVEGHAVHRIYMDTLWLVKAVVESSSSTVASGIATEIDKLLQRQNGSVPTATIYSAGRQEIIRYAEVFEGITYRHVGGQYRILVQGVNNG